ncbi:MAG TPA: hypothetical protein ENO21_04345, partial [Firmicutes bacterium]|nr:hypothetical protein [Bacillota bacterium]
MSARGHWLGDAELWGLTPARFGGIRDELDDHVHCVSARDGEKAAAGARNALAQDAARRHLSSVHLADQVYATLNRWPTRREWLEFMWLGVWFALIVLSDWIAGRAESSLWNFWKDLPHDVWWRHDHDFPTPVIGWTTAGWLLQGVARAGFFASLIASLWRAFRTGWGVVIARILQLKLIHTLLVIAATLLIGDRLWHGGGDYSGLKTEWPNWLTAPAILGVLVVAGAILWIASHRRYWHLGLGLVLAGMFLYPGGPYGFERVRVEMPLAFEVHYDSGGRKVIVPETDQYRINLQREKVNKGSYGRDAFA